MGEQAQSNKGKGGPSEEEIVLEKRDTAKGKGKSKVEVVVSPRATPSRVRAAEESGAEAGSSSSVKRARFDDDDEVIARDAIAKQEAIARFPKARMLTGPHHCPEPGLQRGRGRGASKPARRGR